MSDKYITRQHAQRVLKCGRSKFYQVSGNLPRYRKGRAILFRLSEVKALRDELAAIPPERIKR